MRKFAMLFAAMTVMAAAAMFGGQPASAAAFTGATQQDAATNSTVKQVCWDFMCGESNWRSHRRYGFWGNNWGGGHRYGNRYGHRYGNWRGERRYGNWRHHRRHNRDYRW